MPEVYARGATGPAVAEIRERLVALGLLAEATGADYDDAVDRAVRAFQQSRGLRVDGTVGAETYRALDEARWSLGDRLLHHRVGRPYVGDDVADLQHRLLDLGFDPGRCDGIFGQRTQEALRHFQREVGLSGDGTVGPSTLRAIQALRRAVVGGRPAHLREHEALHRAGRGLAGKTVIIDPTGGGDESGLTVGARGADTTAYDIATRLEGRLGATGCNVFLTRSADGGPSDADRAAFANAAEADLYVAIGVDEDASARCEGVATYFYGAGAGRSSAVGERLAELVQREIVARTDLLDCATHPKSWELLRLTRMPAVQVEAGYLTNPHDAERLAEPAFRDTVAEAVLAAVQRLYLPAEEDPGTGQLYLSA
jgi:N-acetylmuramoyl-L-alanine amidase